MCDFCRNTQHLFCVACLLFKVAIIEASYQDAADNVRQEWQRELQHLKQDVSERRRMMAAQVRYHFHD